MDPDQECLHLAQADRHITELNAFQLSSFAANLNATRASPAATMRQSASFVFIAVRIVDCYIAVTTLMMALLLRSP